MSKIVSPEIPVGDVESLVENVVEENGMVSSLHFFPALVMVNKGSIKDKIYIVSKAFSFGEDDESLTRDEFIACLTATAVGIFRMVKNTSSCPSGEDIEKMSHAVYTELSRGEETVDISEIVIWAQHTFKDDVDMTKTFISETSRYALLLSKDTKEDDDEKDNTKEDDDEKDNMKNDDEKDNMKDDDEKDNMKDDDEKDTGT